MADGKTHALASGTVLVLTAAAALPVAAMGHYDIAAGMVAGATLGHLITPDLDQPGWTYDEARIRKTFGLLAANMWRGWTAFYAFTHKHRGISHIPGIGTAGRWLFLGWPVALLVWWIGVELSPVFVAWMFAFNCVQDFAHLALDRFRLWV